MKNLMLGLLLGLLMAAPASADLVIVNTVTGNTTVNLDGYGWSRLQDYTSIKAALQDISSVADDDGNALTPDSPDTVYVYGNTVMGSAGDEIVYADWNTSNVVLIGDPEAGAYSPAGVPNIWPTQDDTWTFSLPNVATDITIENFNIDGALLSGTGEPWGFQIQGNNEDLTLRNLTISGVALPIVHSNSSDGDANDWIFDQIHIHSCPLSGTGWIRVRDEVLRVTVTNSRFDATDLTRSGSYALVQISGSSGVEVANNQFDLTADVTSGAGAILGLHILPEGGHTPVTHTIEDNVFHIGATSGAGNTSVAIAAYNGGGLVASEAPIQSSKIRNNVISSVADDANDARYGIYLSKRAAHSGSQVWSTSNYIGENRMTGMSVGVLIDGWMRNSTISHNYFLNTDIGVSLSATRGILVANNYFDQGTSALQIQTAQGANNLEAMGHVFVGNYIRLHDQIYQWERSVAPASNDSMSIYAGNVALGVTQPGNQTYTTWSAWENAGAVLAQSTWWSGGWGDIRQENFNGLEPSRALPRDH